MAAGAVFPPLLLFEGEGRFWLAEGFHRLEAYTAAGIAEVPCNVQPGGLREAILHSVGANATHGLQRTNADKRRAILMLIEDEEWAKWSDREIGRQCKVDGKTVTRLREEIAQAHLRKSADSPRLVERNGTTCSMKPRGRAAEPEADPRVWTRSAPEGDDGGEREG